MSENWKAVPGWPTYEASDQGNIRRVSGGRWNRPGKNLRHAVSMVGYHYVQLSHDGRISRMSVHRIVLETFVGPRPHPKHNGAHLDGNRANNHLSNLAWVTAKENAAHKRIHGTMACGERQGSSKLTEAGVREIRKKQAWKRGDTSKAAEQYGVSVSTISKIRRNKWWRHIS